MDWIGKADNKASFALSIESAALAGVLATSREGGLLGDLGGGALVLYWVGVVLLAGGYWRRWRRFFLN